MLMGDDRVLDRLGIDSHFFQVFQQQDWIAASIK